MGSAQPPKSSKQQAAHHKQWAAIARMNIALTRLAHAGYFPRTLTLMESLALRVILQHAFVWEVEGRPATVSKMSRALGLSRATSRRKMSELITYGYLKQVGRYYLVADGMEILQQRKAFFDRYAAVIAQTCKELNLNGH